MGKHKDKKSHKHKKEKKHKKKERKRSTSSSSNSFDEWVEKATADIVKPPEMLPSSIFATTSSNAPRDEWMSLPTLFTSSSNVDRRKQREESKQMAKERDQYNPSTNIRELNPFWKDGGDGLPKFQKPIDDDFCYTQSSSSVQTSTEKSASNWRKKPSYDRKDQPVSEEKPEVNSSSNQLLSDSEMNLLSAKIVKAEIMGNTALVAELKQKLEGARKMKEDSRHQEIILTETNSTGYSRPLHLQSTDDGYGGKSKKQKATTHSDGERLRYFADDDKFSLKQMFENEKLSSVNDQTRDFFNVAGKLRKNDDLDDVFTDNIRIGESDERSDKRKKDKAINEHVRVAESLDKCQFCIQSTHMQKHLMVSLGEVVYLSLPHYEPLTDGHCILVPTRHVSCTTQLDENEWTEMLNFRRALTSMFNAKGEVVIFFETAMLLHRQRHMCIQAIPVAREQGDLAPIYFKKAIDESEAEWSTNKKLVSLAGRGVRRAIPKGLPYFAVSFGMEEGYAHIIEDQRLFPSNFAEEIIGGFLDLHHSKWRKPKAQRFEDQKERVLNFSREWNRFDCTST